MSPNTLAAVAADAAVAVAAAAAAAAAQGRRPLRCGGPSFIDGTSYLGSDAHDLGRSVSSAAESDTASSKEGAQGAADEEWQAAKPANWRYLRLLSGHWSPWTVTLLALHGQPLTSAALEELRCCSSLVVLHLERCGLDSAAPCSGIRSLRRLLLPHNNLRSLRGLKDLPCLEELCLKANPISGFKVGRVGGNVSRMAGGLGLKALRTTRKGVASEKQGILGRTQTSNKAVVRGRFSAFLLALELLSYFCQSGFTPGYCLTCCFLPNHARSGNR